MNLYVYIYICTFFSRFYAWTNDEKIIIIIYHEQLKKQNFRNCGVFSASE